MDGYGKPLAVFFDNLRKQGFRFWLDANGALCVRPPAGYVVSPELGGEISKRAQWMTGRLQLESMFGRPLLADDVILCKTLAAEYGVDLEWQRVELNGYAHHASACVSTMRDADRAQRGEG